MTHLVEHQIGDRGSTSSVRSSLLTERLCCVLEQDILSTGSTQEDVNRPNMSEKLLTVSVNIFQSPKKRIMVIGNPFFCKTLFLLSSNMSMLFFKNEAALCCALEQDTLSAAEY